MTQSKTQENNKNLPYIATSHCLLCNINTQLSRKAVWPRAQLKDLVTVKSSWLAKPLSFLHREADHCFCIKRRGISWHGCLCKLAQAKPWGEIGLSPFWGWVSAPRPVPRRGSAGRGTDSTEGHSCAIPERKNPGITSLFTTTSSLAPLELDSLVSSGATHPEPELQRNVASLGSQGPAEPLCKSPPVFLLLSPLKGAGTNTFPAHSVSTDLLFPH